MQILFVVANLVVVFALSFTELLFFIKIIIFITSLWLNYINFLDNSLIQAFYLNLSVNKSILLTRHNRQIKVNFIKISYYNSVVVILFFANKLKKFKIVVFRSNVSDDLFKSLIILARYNFLPQDKCS